MKSIDSSDQRVIVNCVEYRWDGGFGSIICSFEDDVRRGDTRMIGETLFYAYMVYRSKWFRHPRICWTVPDVTIEFIREFKKALFGLE